MKRNFICLSIIVFGVLFWALTLTAATAAENVTILGTVNLEYQIVTDDKQIYEVAENEKGDEVVEMVDKRVRVTGTVEESEGVKVITVISYEVLGE